MDGKFSRKGYRGPQGDFGGPVGRRVKQPGEGTAGKSAVAGARRSAKTIRNRDRFWGGGQ